MCSLSGPPHSSHRRCHARQCPLPSPQVEFLKGNANEPAAPARKKVVCAPCPLPPLTSPELEAIERAVPKTHPAPSTDWIQTTHGALAQIQSSLYHRKVQPPSGGTHASARCEGPASIQVVTVSVTVLRGARYVTVHVTARVTVWVTVHVTVWVTVHMTVHVTLRVRLCYSAQCNPAPTNH